MFFSLVLYDTHTSTPKIKKHTQTKNSCTCANGWDGADCTTATCEPAAYNPCSNGGSCGVDAQATKHVCTGCTPGFTGDLCVLKTNGQACTADDAVLCASGYCDATDPDDKHCALKPEGVACTAETAVQCASGYCDTTIENDKKCALKPDGEDCTVAGAALCVSTYCNTALKCATKVGNGELCEDGGDCTSGYCNVNLCASNGRRLLSWPLRRR
jgi:hypothetical protein